MIALAPNALANHPDLRSWLAAMIERGGAMFSMSVDSDADVAETHEQSITALDVEDVRRAQGGDEQAFERIVRRYQTEVSRRLQRFSRDPVVHEELVQETFVQAFLGLAKFRGDAPLIHWLHRIAVRVGYRFWKERRTRPIHESLDGQELPAPAARDGSESTRLDEVLKRLSPRDRLVVTLVHLEDRSVEETAALTGWSRTMVKVQAFRARGRLRVLMQEAASGADHERG